MVSLYSVNPGTFQISCASPTPYSLFSSTFIFSFTLSFNSCFLNICYRYCHQGWLTDKNPSSGSLISDSASGGHGPMKHAVQLIGATWSMRKYRITYVPLSKGRIILRAKVQVTWAPTSTESHGWMHPKVLRMSLRCWPAAGSPAPSCRDVSKMVPVSYSFWSDINIWGY